nr:hypothetical protein [Tanacetum cinerariifolium]
ASKKSGLTAKVNHIDDKHIGKDGKPLKVYRRVEGLDTNQFKPGGVPCILNRESVSAIDLCDSSHIQPTHVTDHAPKFSVYLLYVLGINAAELDAINNDLTVTMKDYTGTIPGAIHYKLIGEGGYGKDITVGAALIIANVLVFSPKPSMHYLNITMRNVVKVFRKDTISQIM